MMMHGSTSSFGATSSGQSTGLSAACKPLEEACPCPLLLNRRFALEPSGKHTI
jgi:hypothetical protein